MLAGTMPAGGRAAFFDVLSDHYLVGHRHASQNRPAAAQIKHLGHLIVEFGVRVIVLPTAAVPKLDKILLPSLNQREPFICITAVRTSARSDMQRAKGAVESALLNSHRGVPIRATKMNVSPLGLFVDFLFVDYCEEIDSQNYWIASSLKLLAMTR